MENQNGSVSGPVQEGSPDNKKDNKTLMAALSYIGILVLIPFFTSKDNPYVKFHIKQGLVLLVIEVAVWFLGMMFYSLWPLMKLVKLCVFILAIIGIVNSVKGKEKDLPFVGKFSKYFSNI